MKDGKKESSWFEKVKHFLIDFIESANFDQRSVPTLLSGQYLIVFLKFQRFVPVYQFSGLKQSVAQYKPGSGGKDSKTGEYHYRCVIDSIQVTASSIKTKKDLIDKIKKTQPLDGAGMLHLILQDLSMASFFDKPRNKLGGPPSGVSAEEWTIENVMVIITDDQWDTKGLKNERGTPIDEMEIIKVLFKYFKMF